MAHFSFDKGRSLAPSGALSNSVTWENRSATKQAPKSAK
jgi:hypothetical protein